MSLEFEADVVQAILPQQPRKDILDQLVLHDGDDRVRIVVEHFLREGSELAAQKDVEPSLVDFDLLEDVLTEGSYECSNCYENKLEFSDLFQCGEGTHLYCKDCVTQSIVTAIGEGKLDFPCLEGTCPGDYPVGSIGKLIPEALHTAVTRRIAARAVLEVPGLENLYQCPFCDFAAILDDGAGTIFRCQNKSCMKESCKLCKRPNHLPAKCTEVEEDAAVKVRKEMEEAMTEAVLRVCPKCGKSFVKTFGCNYVQCTCGTMICYVCKKACQKFSHDRTCHASRDTDALHQKNLRDGALRAREILKAKKEEVVLINDPAREILGETVAERVAREAALKKREDEEKKKREKEWEDEIRREADKLKKAMSEREKKKELKEKKRQQDFLKEQEEVLLRAKRAKEEKERKILEEEQRRQREEENRLKFIKEQEELLRQAKEKRDREEKERKAADEKERQRVLRKQEDILRQAREKRDQEDEERKLEDEKERQRVLREQEDILRQAREVRDQEDEERKLADEKERQRVLREQKELFCQAKERHDKKEEEKKIKKEKVFQQQAELLRQAKELREKREAHNKRLEAEKQEKMLKEQYEVLRQAELKKEERLKQIKAERQARENARMKRLEEEKRKQEEEDLIRDSISMKEEQRQRERRHREWEEEKARQELKNREATLRALAKRLDEKEREERKDSRERDHSFSTFENFRGNDKEYLFPETRAEKEVRNDYFTALPDDTSSRRLPLVPRGQNLQQVQVRTSTAKEPGVVNHFIPLATWMHPHVIKGLSKYPSNVRVRFRKDVVIVEGEEHSAGQVEEIIEGLVQELIKSKEICRLKLNPSEYDGLVPWMNRKAEALGVDLEVAIDSSVIVLEGIPDSLDKMIRGIREYVQDCTKLKEKYDVVLSVDREVVSAFLKRGAEIMKSFPNVRINLKTNSSKIQFSGPKEEVVNCGKLFQQWKRNLVPYKQ